MLLQQTIQMCALSNSKVLNCLGKEKQEEGTGFSCLGELDQIPTLWPCGQIALAY